MGNPELSYDLFQQAASIDIGQNMKSSDHGIHAASIGGMWQCVVYGFGGVRMLGGNLRINPNLPEQWNGLNFPIFWKGERLEVSLNKETITIKRPDFNGAALEIEVAGEPRTIETAEVTFNV